MLVQWYPDLLSMFLQNLALTPVKYFGIAENIQAVVLEEVEAQLCRMLTLQKQDWTPLCQLV